MKYLLILKVIPYALAAIIAFFEGQRLYKKKLLNPELFNIVAVVLGMGFMVLSVVNILLEMIYLKGPMWHYLFFLGLFIVGVVLRISGTRDYSRSTKNCE